MESEFLPDKSIPPVPLKTYRWEDLRRAREAGAYPWTYLLKPPLEGEITADDILRESTPRRSMSREFSRSRTHSPVDGGDQRILNLDSSPGSSRKHGEEGEDEGVHVPNFSKEISLDDEDDNIKHAVDSYMANPPEKPNTSHLVAPIEIPTNVSPKSILKRRGPDQHYFGMTETREKSKCCHPLVNKIKHLADKTLHKLDRNDNERSPKPKRKKDDGSQEIRQLKTSPGAVRRQKFSAIKLGDSDEMSKTLSVDATPPSRKRKEHIYEDIEEAKSQGDKSLHFSPELEEYQRGVLDHDNNSTRENDSIAEKKSNASQDPSLIADESNELKPEEHIMEKLHRVDDINKEAVILDDDGDVEEPNVDEIFQNQLDEDMRRNGSPNITITEIIDDVESGDHSSVPRVELSPSPHVDNNYNEDAEMKQNPKVWSKTSSDHEYEIIEKPPPNIVYTAPSIYEKPTLMKADDELSSTTSIERKYLQHTSDEEEQHEDDIKNSMEKEDESLTTEALQKNIEDRFFVNTPSTVSRTECEISTSQVDSSALENLPLKRDSRSKNAESIDSKIQQRIKEGTGKLKTQAGKLKTKLQNIKATMPDKPKINFPDRSKFKMPERPKFTLPDRRKFSLPDRPKFKKINISEKLSLGDRKKFSLPERPKFNVPDFPKFKFPDRPKVNFPSMSRKKEYKVEAVNESNPDLSNVATVQFETKTYPRLFNRKKKSTQLTTSSPTLAREDTPPPIFTFTRVKKTTTTRPMTEQESQERPREYGVVDNSAEFEGPNEEERKHFDETYDFDKVGEEYILNENQDVNFYQRNSSSIPNISTSEQEYNHVINEINNDEFFVRPRGISRENVQVREYLSDEIRQAFKIPKNALALMGSSTSREAEMCADDVEADPELFEDNEDMRYSIEDINDRDDGYYTFPPIRPSRAKRKKKELESVQYIDEPVNDSMQFSEVDLGLSHDHVDEMHLENLDNDHTEFGAEEDINENVRPTQLQNEYENEDIIISEETMPILSQTLPMPPRRKKKSQKQLYANSSLADFNQLPPDYSWKKPEGHSDDIIVYRTEHEYVVPQEQVEDIVKHSPLPPRRNRSRSSRGTSVCDDDRTSHGAESLTLDIQVANGDEMFSDRQTRHESPGYATVDKGPYSPSKLNRRSKSKTPPIRRRKSSSSERKYYTVGPTKPVMPDRPPRKKSSTSLMTLDSITKRSASGDITQYDEIEEPSFDEIHKELISGEVVSKMKDRPLPPPPRPPRGSRKKSKVNNDTVLDMNPNAEHKYISSNNLTENNPEDIVEIEVSTQTDPLPDDMDFELGMDDHLDISMSSSTKEMVDEDHINKSMSKLIDSPRISRPSSRSEKSFKISDPKISELSRSPIGRTSPTVILVERRVSSPTRINEREEMLTEASLTVQQIEVDESKIPEVPPLPTPRINSKNVAKTSDERALEKISNTSRDIQLDNLVTQRLQVRDLDVGRLNVSELQASKILVSDIEGMTLQVTELDSKSGHLSVSGIEFSQTVIDEIVKKFAELSSQSPVPNREEIVNDPVRPVSREEETQTDQERVESTKAEATQNDDEIPPSPPPRPPNAEEVGTPPKRPPPPDLTPLLYSYLQDLSMPSTSLFHLRQPRERPFSEFHESLPQSSPAPSRRVKRKPTAPHSESSSEDNRLKPSPRRMPPPVMSHEPSVAEAGAQFLRVCHSSISRTFRNMFNSLMSYISGTEDKKDVQMALVIFLVLIAGLIMFGLSDSRTIHHHHWEFFNPPDGNQ